MSRLNLFVAQSIRQKLLFGTLFLAIIPVAVTALMLGRESVSSGRAALAARARAGPRVGGPAAGAGPGVGERGPRRAGSAVARSADRAARLQGRTGHRLLR